MSGYFKSEEQLVLAASAILKYAAEKEKNNDIQGAAICHMFLAYMQHNEGDISAIIDKVVKQNGVTT